MRKLEEARLEKLQEIAEAKYVDYSFETRSMALDFIDKMNYKMLEVAKKILTELESMDKHFLYHKFIKYGKQLLDRYRTTYENIT